MKSLTPAVARALEVARLYAASGGAAEVLPEHVLHGLLEEEEGRATTVLTRAGLRWAEYLLGRVARAEEGPVLPLAGRTQETLRLARELAVDLTGESTLSSEPLLLALLRSDSALLVFLEQHGLSLAQLESSLEQQKPPIPSLDEPLELADSVETMDLARILDVGANRAREAMRIVEDYCRFVLDDAFLSGELKRLRHDFTAALEEFAPPGLLPARETLLDVGTTISTESERSRASLTDVVRVNLKRSQEALRSLEEFGKVAHPKLGEHLEQLRYRAYTLERAVLFVGDARQLLRQVRLYALLSGASCERSLSWTIEQAVLGGVTMIQLREKSLCDRDLFARAREVRRLTSRLGVLFIVNDRPDVARVVEADGVHLGQDDLPVKEARRVLGARAIIGVSTHNLEQVRRAVLDGASYLGVGPTFPSGTKSFEEFPGLAFVTSATAETALPAFVIGGVNLKTIEPAVRAGARRVAVSQAIAAADDPRATAAALLAMLPAGE
jgi:thiamine-phosphate pyrophosphorylase